MPFALLATLAIILGRAGMLESVKVRLQRVAT
jgi:hypothetical protein